MRFIGIIGLILILALSFVISSDRKKIRYSPILIMLVLQFLLGFILLRTTAGTTIVSGLAGVFDALLRFAGSGVDFVFGGIANKGSFPFFLNVLMPIVFHFCNHRNFALREDFAPLHERCRLSP